MFCQQNEFDKAEIPIQKFPRSVKYLSWDWSRDDNATNLIGSLTDHVSMDLSEVLRKMQLNYLQNIAYVKKQV